MKLFSRLRKDVTEQNARDTNAHAQSNPTENKSNITNNQKAEPKKPTSEPKKETTQSENNEKTTQTIHAPEVSETSNGNNAVVSVHDQRVKIEKSMNNLSHEYAQLRGRLKLNLFSERDDYQGKLNKLNKQLNDILANEKAVQDNIEKNKNDDDGKEKERLAGIRADQKHQNELLYKYKEQQKSLATSIEKNDKILDKKQAELDKNQKEETDLSAAIKNETDLQKMMVLMEKQKTQVEKIYKNREKITAELAEAQSVLGNDKKDLNDVNININEISSTIALLKTKINQIESTIKNNRSQRTSMINQLEASSKSNKNDIDGLKIQVKNVTDNINYVDKYIKDVFHAAYLVREVYLEPTKQYLVLSDSVDKEQQETDYFDIVNYLERKMDTTVTLVTSFYNNHFSDIIDGYTKSMNIERPDVINLFENMQQSDNPSTKQVTIPESNDWVTRTDVKTHNTLIYDQSGNLMMTVEYFNDQIDRINYFKNSKIVKTNIYNTDGILSSAQIFNKDQKLDEENFYRTDGSIVITINYESGVANDFQVFDGSGLLTQDFDKKEEFVTWWINSLYAGQSELVFVGSSTDLLYKAVAASRDQEKTDLITFVESAHSNIGRIKALLHKEPLINNIFVQYERDLHSIENTTDRDISVSAIKTAVSDEMYLPDSLKI
ncbi:hypothetical protein [Companilactobacillus ginsenosidimutans]|uniref:Uncharacterized protein n=1 Tax=Companilactobacillus ginsenosidimutans TaxID=1007676 RepID=A0A0H4QLY1_9LACO|nr:hypothetical protein [Companilactobacillus ginsenosidimutans]AKP67713.1 hypothetical protein ABM34_09365 [Companilactobacillus ginsenosidimutans]